MPSCGILKAEPRKRPQLLDPEAKGMGGACEGPGTPGDRREAPGLVLLESKAPGGQGASLVPVGKPRAKRRGINPNKSWGGRSPCCPLGSDHPSVPQGLGYGGGSGGGSCGHLWTSVLFRREVNLNWSYRGSWLEN